MAKKDTVTITVAVGDLTRSVELNRQSVINAPSYAIESAQQLVQDVTLEYTTSQREGLAE